MGEDNIASLRRAGASLFVAGSAVFGDPGSRRRVPPPRRSRRVSIERALELVDRSPGNGYPNPTVGAVVVAADGTTLGEGVTEPAGGRHAEVVALDAAGAAARRCDALRDDGALRPPRPHTTVRRPDPRGGRRARRRRVPRPEPGGGGGAGRLRQAGVETELLDLREARRQNEAWRTWAALGRPYVILKLAVSVDGRAAVPGRRWVSGEPPVVASTSCAPRSTPSGVGMGTVRADAPRLDARDVPVVRPPRRLAFGRGPLPDGSELELRSGPTEEELGALAAEGVQSLLLEGGPTIAASFLAHGWVDRLLVFVAPVLAGGGPAMLGELPEPLDLGEPTVELVGTDVLLDWRLRDEVSRCRPSRPVASRRVHRDRARGRACGRGRGRRGRAHARRRGARDRGVDGRRRLRRRRGVCLTAEAVDEGRLRFHAVAETLGRTTLGQVAGRRRGQRRAGAQGR